MLRFRSLLSQVRINCILQKPLLFCHGVGLLPASSRALLLRPLNLRKMAVPQFIKSLQRRHQLRRFRTRCACRVPLNVLMTTLCICLFILCMQQGAASWPAREGYGNFERGAVLCSESGSFANWLKALLTIATRDCGVSCTFDE